MQMIENSFPPGLKPSILFLPLCGAAEAVPFQSEWVSRSRGVFVQPVQSPEYAELVRPSGQAVAFFLAKGWDAAKLIDGRI